MLQIKYNQSPGNEPSGKQARKKKKGGRKLGRKEEIIAGQVTKEGCRITQGLIWSMKTGRIQGVAKNENI